MPWFLVLGLARAIPPKIIPVSENGMLIQFRIPNKGKKAIMAPATAKIPKTMLSMPMEFLLIVFINPTSSCKYRTISLDHGCEKSTIYSLDNYQFGLECTGSIQGLKNSDNVTRSCA